MTINSVKPVIQQVIDILMSRIRSGEYDREGRLPSESKLADEFGVSRTTVRTALTKMESDGLINRRQGEGTFINKRVMDVTANLGQSWDFKCMIEDSGREPRVEKISITRRAAVEDEEVALELNPGEEVLELIRLYYADGVPVIYSRNMFPVAFLSVEKPPEEFDPTLPIHHFLDRYFHQELAYCISDISAVLSPPRLEPYLEIEAGEPLFRFHDMFYDIREVPLMYGDNFYHDKIIRVRVARSWR